MVLTRLISTVDTPWKNTFEENWRDADNTALTVTLLASNIVARKKFNGTRRKRSQERSKSIENRKRSVNDKNRYAFRQENNNEYYQVRDNRSNNNQRMNEIKPQDARQQERFDTQRGNLNQNQSFVRIPNQEMQVGRQRDEYMVENKAGNSNNWHRDAKPVNHGNNNSRKKSKKRHKDNIPVRVKTAEKINEQVNIVDRSRGSREQELDSSKMKLQCQNSDLSQRRFYKD